LLSLEQDHARKITKNNKNQNINNQQITSPLNKLNKLPKIMPGKSPRSCQENHQDLEQDHARKITKNNQQIKQNESPKIINKLINEDETSVPGGSTQTRDYYSDSSSRRRKSLDRSQLELETGVSGHHHQRLLLPRTETGSPNSNSKLVVPDRERKGSSKKSRRWSKAWNRGERGWVRGLAVRIGQLGREGRRIWKGRE
jgi:hypothetical protein